MKFTVGIAMSPLDQLTALAQTAEEVGFANIALPDSLFFMETAAADYPYTPDGSRMWNAETPWVDPLIAAAAMGAVTSTIGFYTTSSSSAPATPCCWRGRWVRWRTSPATASGSASESAGHRRSSSGAALPTRNAALASTR